jgi:hypothetical protein
MIREANSNITPGGSVMVGPDEEHGAWVSIGNLYTYDTEATDRSTIVNVENSLQISLPNDGDSDEVLSVPISRDECYELAWMFITVARRDGNWNGIEDS